MVGNHERGPELDTIAALRRPDDIPVWRIRARWRRILNNDFYP